MLEVCSMLVRSGIFSKEDVKELETMERFFNVRRLQKGEAVCRWKNRADHFIFVGYGLVRSFSPSFGERPITASLIGPGEIVGLSSTLTGDTYGIEAIAHTYPVLVTEVPRPLLISVLECSSSRAMAFAKMAANETRRIERKLALCTMQVENRLAATLLDLAERFGDEMEDGTLMIPVKFTRAELASLVGATSETIVRILSKWTQSGVLITTSGGLCLDPESLTQRATHTQAAAL